MMNLPKLNNTTSIVIQSCSAVVIHNFCTIALFSTTDVKKLTKEIDTMVSFDHPNVMSLIGVSVDREMPFLIMPFMANGSILEYLKNHKEELLHTSEATAAEVC